MNRASENIGQELAILAHELREPLASILFAVDCTSETPHDEFANRQMCELIGRQVRYLARIIDDVLEVNQVSHGKLSLRKELIDIGSVIETAVETNRALFTKRRHRLTISMPRERILLMADPSRVRQVVNNLLTNAGKYTEPGGRISVTVEARGDEVSIEVRDTGIGIPADLLPRVFELFHQGGGRRDGFSGLGIGLALVKSLVELHGGSITAHSDGKGTGSTFVVLLPGVIRMARGDSNLAQNPRAGRPTGECAAAYLHGRLQCCF
jgi:signal transduction histidine kinase